jgi:hypothetical protein
LARIREVWMRFSVKTAARVAAVMFAAVMLTGVASAGATQPDCQTKPLCPPSPVPEIDPGSAAGARTLLVGGLLSVADRRRPAKV